MPRQRIPDIEFNHFTIGQLPELFRDSKIVINEEYQRSDIWKHKQQIALIESINNSYSIGVLVLFLNENGKYEILDGQQRLTALREYLEDRLDLSGSSITPYASLGMQEKNLFDAYCVYYLRLKSFDEETKEEDITQTFLRLQEGTPLNKAEKINAYRGAFKDLFRDLRTNNQLFALLGKDNRFRFRLLAAELLLLEFEGDFRHRSFPNLSLDTFKGVLVKYKRQDSIDQTKVTFLKGNLDIIRLSLNNLLTAMRIRDLIAFYLLVSYLRRTKAHNQNFQSELRVFAEDFLRNLHSFTIYDTSPPLTWTLGKKRFKEYMKYKEHARAATSSESIEARFNFIFGEYKRQFPIIHKDRQRLFDIEQKRNMFFRQGGQCTYCNKPLIFKEGSGDHIIAYGDGGPTDIANGQLLHPKCHEKLERERRNATQAPQ